MNKKSFNFNILAALTLGISLSCLSVTAVDAQATQRRTQTPAKGNAGGTNRGAATDPARSKMDDQTFAQKAMEANLAEIMMAKLALQKASSQRVKEYAQMMIDEHSQANDRLKALVSGIAMGNAPEQMGGMQHDTHTNGTTGTMGNTNAGTTSAGTNGSAGTTGSGTSNSGTTSNQNTSSDATPDKNNVDNRTEKTGSESGLGVAASPAIGSGVGITDNAGDHAPGEGSAYFNDSTMLSAEHRATQDRLAKLTGSAFDREYIQVQIKDHDKTATLFENQIKNGQDQQLNEYARNLLPAIRKHRQMAFEISNSMRTGSTSRGGR